MKKSLLLVLLASVVLSAAPDARLATVRRAFVVPVDELGDDVGVASCFATHLGSLTPVQVTTSKDEADVVFRIAAHVPGTTSKILLGSGNPPTARLFAELPDGTKLWDGSAKYAQSQPLESRTGVTTADIGKSIECGLADELANTLRDAMRKARDKR